MEKHQNGLTDHSPSLEEGGSSQLQYVDILLKHTNTYSKDKYGEEINPETFMIMGDGHNVKEVVAETVSGKEIFVPVSELYEVFEKGGITLEEYQRLEKEYDDLQNRYHEGVKECEYVDTLDDKIDEVEDKLRQYEKENFAMGGKVAIKMTSNKDEADQLVAKLQSENPSNSYSIDSYKGSYVVTANYEDGGRTTVTVDAFANDINAYVLYSYNFYSPQQFDAFGTEKSSMYNHLKDKWASLYKRVGASSVMNRFWTELDGSNRLKLAKWIKFIWKDRVMDDVSDSPQVFAHNITHWVMFAYNYPSNFMDAFNGSMREHLEEKFHWYYSMVGAEGVMNKFYNNLDGNNQRLLAQWILENYDDLPYSRGGKIQSGCVCPKCNTMKKGGWIQDATAEMERKGTVGSFTKMAKRHGETPIEYAKEVLDNPSKHTLKTRRKAQFVKNTNPEKFASGGAIQIGDAVTFKDVRRGMVKEGTITNILEDGDYVVSSGFSQLLLEPNEIIEVRNYESPKSKKWWQFKDGGLIEQRNGEDYVIGIKNLMEVSDFFNSRNFKLETLIDRREIEIKKVTSKGLITNNGLVGWKYIDDRHTEKNGLMIFYDDFERYFYFKMTDQERKSNPYGFDAEKRADIEDRFRDTEEEGYVFNKGGEALADELSPKEDRENKNAEIKLLLKTNGTNKLQYSSKELKQLHSYHYDYNIPIEVCSKMWGLAKKHNILNWNKDILVFNCGTGNLLSYPNPKEVKNVYAYEKCTVKRQISTLLYAENNISVHWAMPYNAKYNLALGIINYDIEGYSLLNYPQALEKGGHLIVLIQNKMAFTEDVTSMVNKHFDLVDGYHLPSDVMPYYLLILRRKDEI